LEWHWINLPAGSEVFFLHEEYKNIVAYFTSAYSHNSNVFIYLPPGEMMHCALVRRTNFVPSKIILWKEV
jgi:hypothetical protein